jgi:Protein of unknown function (DUF4231)
MQCVKLVFRSVPWPGIPTWYDENLDKFTEKDYVKTRVRPFADRLYHKASNHMRNFYTLQILVIVFGALIPIINVVNFTNPNDQWTVRILSAILGAAVVATTGVQQLTKLRETAIVFRIISAKLQKEYHSFFLRANNYSIYDQNDDGRKKAFVKNVESLILSATSEYYDLFRQGPTTEHHDTPSGVPKAIIKPTSQTVHAGETVILDGSESTGDIVSYKWDQLKGTHVPLLKPNEKIVSYDAPELATNETQVFMLTVGDNTGKTSATQATVSVPAITSKPDKPNS